MNERVKFFACGAIFGVFLTLFGIFIYNNVIVPYPYRHQLKECLNEARGNNDKVAEDLCFRTYPHFN